eukprot:5763934-Alexandrium_andersonii.AAC.1
MSASLVGSEMCIRDRPLLAVHQARLRFVSIIEVTVESMHAVISKALRTCLLYTSDAADDM